jgi:uncharacterized protein YceK
MKSFFAFALLLATVLFLSGCATTAYREAPVAAAPAALTLAQIKEMTARGVSDDTILSALRASRAVYRLTSKDVLDLQEAKVSPAVIDYLLSTPQFYPPQPTPRYRSYYYYYPPPWPYWYPYWGWHYDWHFDFHHGHH